MPRATSKVVSALGALSALVVVADVIPVTPVVGVPGARFTAGWVAAVLCGIIGGPWVGALAALTGSAVSMLIGLRVPLFSLLTPLTPAVAALEAGLLARAKWLPGAAVTLSLAAMWALTPAVAAPPTILYITAAAIAFASGRHLKLSPESLDGRGLGRVLAIAYVANATRHALGSLLLVTLYEFPTEVFFTIAPLMAVEQATFATVTALVAIPALRAVSKHL